MSEESAEDMQSFLIKVTDAVSVFISCASPGSYEGLKIMKVLMIRMDKTQLLLSLALFIVFVRSVTRTNDYFSKNFSHFIDFHLTS